MDKKKLIDIIHKNENTPGGLIAILEEIQEKYTYLPETALRQVSEETGYLLADIYGVATFYKAFSLKPRGRHCLSACLGTACHVRGAQRIVEEFTQQLGIKPGETTPDNEITFETVNCLGACALGPIVVSDGHYFANVAAKKVREIVRWTREGSAGDEESAGCEFPIEASCPRCNRSLMDREHCLDGLPSIAFIVSKLGKNGWARMSSLYGRFSRVHEQDIPDGAIFTIQCPHCLSLLHEGVRCVECGAPMAPMKISEGDGVLRICTRAGCKGHLLEFNGTVL